MLINSINSGVVPQAHTPDSAQPEPATQRGTISSGDPDTNLVSEASKGGYRFVKKEDYDSLYKFSSAPVYRKTRALSKDDVEKCKETKLVETKIEEKSETGNVAYEGDYIITGTRGERYVITAADFPNFYEADNPDETKMTKYLSKNDVRAIKLKESIEIIGPWGKLETTEAGGYICESSIKLSSGRRNVYLVAEKAFRDTYTKVDIQNSEADIQKLV